MNIKRNFVGQTFFASVNRKIYHSPTKFTKYHVCMANGVYASKEFLRHAKYAIVYNDLSKYTTAIRSILRKVIFGRSILNQTRLFLLLKSCFVNSLLTHNSIHSFFYHHNGMYLVMGTVINVLAILNVKEDLSPKLPVTSVRRKMER